MLSLIRQPEWDQPLDHSEAVTRLASVRHALRLVDHGFCEGPGDDADQGLTNCWDEAGPARQRWFDRRSSLLVGQTAAGIEALLGARHQGQEPHEEASRALVNEIRRELGDIARIITA